MNPEQIISNLQSEISKKDAYIGLLEKVNQQISYTWNPINTAFVILSIIIGIGAIITAILIFMQSKDFKRRFDNFLSEQKKQHNKIIINTKSRLAKLDKIANKYRQEFETIKKKPSDQKIKELEQKLNQIEKEKENITISSGIGSFAHNRCNICGTYMPYPTLDGVCDNCKNWPGNPPAININGN